VEKPNDCDVVDPNLEQIAWFWCTDTTLMPGKLKQPNAWGLYDMLGHVAEWVWDYLYEYEESGISAPLVDPVGDDPGEVTPWNRVFRGGSTSYSASGCRAAHRGSFFEDSGATCGTGIRLAITAGPGVAQPTDTATETDSESDMDAGRDGGAQQ
jgi:formylglycine-generating enzyme required for sulfatase activity